MACGGYQEKIILVPAESFGVCAVGREHPLGGDRLEEADA